MFFEVFFKVVRKNTPQNVQGSSKIESQNKSMGKTSGQTIFKTKNGTKTRTQDHVLLAHQHVGKKTCDLHSLQMIPSTMDVKNPYPRYSMYGIFTYMYHEKWPNVGKYTSPMDAMGFEMLGKCSNVRVANAEPGPGLGGCGKMGLNQHSSHLCFFWVNFWPPNSKFLKKWHII